MAGGDNLKVHASSPDDLAQKWRADLTRVMRGFTTAPADDPGFALVIGRSHWRFEVDPRRLPLPQIVQFVFKLLGSRDLGRGEKLAWEYPFRLDGVACSMALQKFGLRLYIERERIPTESAAEAFRNQVVKGIIAGQRVVEREVLRPLSDQQLKLGNITVRNQYHMLHRTYEYFRDGARISYNGDGRLAKTPPARGGSWLMPERTEGWWNTFAMVVAYSSLLEHVLVGCLPFAGFDPAKEGVTDFIGRRWTDKFKRIFDLRSDPVAMAHYNTLARISEQYRNTYGHGGFDKAGATVGFHIPGIGAIPAVLSDIRDTPHFEFVPSAQTDFDAICASFDGFEKWLASGEMKNAWTWITAGMDYRFDDEFRQEIEANASDFDAFAERCSAMVDRSINMDW